jgi:hypothetical protein
MTEADTGRAAPATLFAFGVNVCFRGETDIGPVISYNSLKGPGHGWRDLLRYRTLLAIEELR